MTPTRILPLLCVALLSACASTGDLENTQHRIETINRQANARMQQIEERLSNERLLDLVSRLDTIQQDIAKLRGSNDMLQHQLQTLEQKQNDLYNDLDQRLSALEKPNANNTATNNNTTPTAPSADANIDNQYNAALQALRQRQFSKALVSLKSFIDSYPNSNQAIDARYWLGVAHTALRQYDAAIDIHRRFATNYPQNPKVPEALWNIGNCQRELGQDDLAKETYRRLIKQYPQSNVAEKARQSLNIK